MTDSSCALMRVVCVCEPVRDRADRRARVDGPSLNAPSMLAERSTLKRRMLPALRSLIMSSITSKTFFVAGGPAACGAERRRAVWLTATVSPGAISRCTGSVLPA